MTKTFRTDITNEYIYCKPIRTVNLIAAQGKKNGAAEYSHMEVKLYEGV